MDFNGIIIGCGTFVIIGALHPVVIKAEYYFGTAIWPAFLLGGVTGIILSPFSNNTIHSALLAIFGFSMLWSIRELFQQKKRVEKDGWQMMLLAKK